MSTFKTIFIHTFWQKKDGLYQKKIKKLIQKTIIYCIINKQQHKQTHKIKIKVCRLIIIIKYLKSRIN